MDSKKLRHRWFGGAAACLAVALLAGLLIPGLLPQKSATDPTQPDSSEPDNTPNEPKTDGLTAFTPARGLPGEVASPELPKLALYPTGKDGFGFDQAAYNAWHNSKTQQYNQPEGYADSLRYYFSQSIPVLLSNDKGDNKVCSPVNIYMALAMLAETTGGSTRQQILELMDAPDIETLRTQASHVWNAHYSNDGASTCLLANSLWLQQNCGYDQNTADRLAQSYYASVFQGALGSDEMNKSLQTWLNENTGGLLKEQAGQVELPAQTVMALASTIYYRAKWDSTFSPNQTKEDIFHAPGGDITCDFMKTTLTYGPYYYGDGYSAVALRLEDGAKMWLFLPDDGEAPQTLLARGNVITAVLDPQNAQSAQCMVHLSLPKFDVTGSMELSDALKALGITEAFGSNADFSPILPDTKAYLDRADHAARVKIDEEGVEAAAYTVMVACGAAMPPKEEVDLILDRPFLFVIASRDDLPLFAGIVNNP